MSSTYTIPKIENGPATANKFNTPLNYIESALNSLDDKISSLANKSAVVQFDGVLNSDVVAGDLVYFDSTDAKFKKAIALLRGIPGTQGQSVEAASCRVEGLVLATNPVTILRNGYYNSSIINTTLGVGAAAGLYYLSPSTAGKAVLDPGWNMRQPCITYYGNGKFSLMTSYLAHDNHHHASYTVTGVWTSGSLTEGGVTYNWYITIPSADLGQISKDVTAVFHSGALAGSTFYCSSADNKLWFSGTTAPTSGTVVLFNNYPFAYGDSVVRAVESDNLSVTNSNGIYKVNKQELTVGSTSNSATAVSNISGNTKQFTPVVSDIYAGFGAQVGTAANGVKVISATKETYTAAANILNNATQMSVNGMCTYVTFPASIASYAVFSKFFNMDSSEASITYDVNFWCTYNTTGAATLYSAIYWMPADPTTPVDIPTVPASTSGMKPVVLAATANGKMAYSSSTTATSVTIDKPGTLFAVVRAASPNTAVNINQGGFDMQATAITATSNNVDPAVMATLRQVLTYNANY